MIPQLYFACYAGRERPLLIFFYDPKNPVNDGKAAATAARYGVQIHKPLLRLAKVTATEDLDIF